MPEHQGTQKLLLLCFLVLLSVVNILLIDRLFCSAFLVCGHNFMLKSVQK